MKSSKEPSLKQLKKRRPTSGKQNKPKDKHSALLAKLMQVGIELLVAKFR